ncbi:MAG: hypothetical protein AB8B61_04050 [Cyclobacteriaceae bacterium]
MSCEKEEDSLSDSELTSIINNSLYSDNKGQVSGSVTGETAINAVPVSYNFSNDNKTTFSKSIRRFQGHKRLDITVRSELQRDDKKKSDISIRVIYNLTTNELDFFRYGYNYSFIHKNKVYKFTSNRNIYNSDDVVRLIIDKTTNVATIILNDVQTIADDNIVNSSAKEAAIQFTYTYKIPEIDGGVDPVTNY